VEIGLIGINKYAKFLNFACDIHAFAFQRYLTEQGYSSTFLDYKPAYYGNFNMRNPAKSAEESYLRGVEKGLSASELERLAELAVGYRSVTPERRVRFDKFKDFERNNLRFTEKSYNSDLLEVEDPGFDCYMCVTDVIWQSINKHVFDRGFLLGSKAFEGKPKIAYAASRGASGDFNESQADLFFKYLQDIDDISIRERDFSEYIRNNSEFEPTDVIDPVLLHDKPFWDDVAVAPREEKYVLLYYVMEQSKDTIAKAVEYAKIHDLTLVELSDRPLKYGKVMDPDVKHIARYDVGPDEWLGYIQNAECVFTNSFHGCCFSVIFERPFFVGKRHGQKVPNFLATFGFSDRQFDSKTNVRDFPSKIDFSDVPALLKKNREVSEKFVLGALERAEKSISDGHMVDHAPYERRRRGIEFPANFNSGSARGDVQVSGGGDEIVSKTVPSGSIEYHRTNYRYTNSGDSRLERSRFQADSKELVGWTLRFRIDNHWFWILRDGSIATASALSADENLKKAVIPDGGQIPHIPVNQIGVAVFTAQWKSAQGSVAAPKRGLKRLFLDGGRRQAQA
jgi:hypothetical protein